MPHIDAVVETPVNRSFRVEQVAGMFDVPLESKSRERFSVDVPGMDEDWEIGVIVGPSGSGKSTIAREVYGKSMIEGFKWPRDKAVVDGFPESVSGKDISAMFNAVGFSSPPAWVRPYRVLSGGQRFRCDLARALMSDWDVVAFDEFTSVVDRTVAKIGSACVAKAIRKDRAKCKRFVAVTCHYDVLDWLEPDWILDMASGELARGRLRRRPEVSFEVRRCERELWRVFGGHHYLSANLHKAARCYAAVCEGRSVGFCATLHSMGHKGRRGIHRLVVLPDWQGIGIGGRLLDAVARHESQDQIVSIRTSHPSLIASLKRSGRWIARTVSRGVNVAHAGTLGRKGGIAVGSEGRVTVSFQFAGSERSAA